MTRLYFWFQGVSKQRIGGPWWMRDFTDPGDFAQFMRDIQSFLEAFAITDGAEPLDPLNVKPPPFADIKWRQETDLRRLWQPTSEGEP